MRPRFRIGPGLLVAMSAAIVIAYVKWPEYQQRDAEQRAMNELRAEIAHRKTQPVKPARTLDNLWARRDELKLTREQIAALQKLRAQEQQTVAPLQREAERAAREFQVWMDDAKRRGGATISDIQRHSAPVIEASSAVEQARRVYFQSALSRLTPQQRAQVERTFR